MVTETSKLSYAMIQDFLGEKQYEVYMYIKLHPGQTDTEIAKGLGYEDVNSVRPRRFELVDQGLVCIAGKRKCKYTGKVCIIWRASSENEYKEFSGQREMLTNTEIQNILKKIKEANKHQLKLIAKECILKLKTNQ
jgi:predicted transcriptional regulator